MVEAIRPVPGQARNTGGTLGPSCLLHGTIFGDLDEMILAALATVETGYACFLKDLPEIHNGLLF